MGKKKTNNTPQASPKAAAVYQALMACELPEATTWVRMTGIARYLCSTAGLHTSLHVVERILGLVAEIQYEQMIDELLAAKEEELAGMDAQEVWEELKGYEHMLDEHGYSEEELEDGREEEIAHIMEFEETRLHDLDIHELREEYDAMKKEEEK